MGTLGNECGVTEWVTPGLLRMSYNMHAQLSRGLETYFLHTVSGYLIFYPGLEIPILPICITQTVMRGPVHRLYWTSRIWSSSDVNVQSKWRNQVTIHLSIFRDF